MPTERDVKREHRLVWFVMIGYVVLVVALLATVTALRAEEIPRACAARDAVVAHLSDKYGEHPVEGGLNVNGQVAELFLSEGGETWTITATSPGMLTCMVMAGKFWSTITPVVGDPS